MKMASLKSSCSLLSVLRSETSTHFPLKTWVCPGAEGLLGRELMASGQPGPRALVLTVLPDSLCDHGQGFYISGPLLIACELREARLGLI